MNGEEEMVDRKAYPSDLTDAEWEILRPLIPGASPNATIPIIDRREIVNGILYVLRSGCPWRLLPNDLPAWGTVYYYFRTWRNEGIWDQVLEALRKRMRQVQGRDEEPSAAVIDSQSIKTSAVRGPEKGYDAGKKIWGRKRHALVDTQGNLIAVKVTAASESDLVGSKKLLSPLKGLLPRLALLWGDSHYGGTLIEWVKEHFGFDIEIVRRLGTASDAETTVGKLKAARHPSGFQVQPRRWVVERSFAWMTRWRRLSRDHEGLPETSEAFIKLSASRRMLSHLAAAFP
jgi:putative transposase